VGGDPDNPDSRGFLCIRGQAHAHVTGDVPRGTVWMRDGWIGINTLTDGAAVLPDDAVDTFGLSGGQASFGAAVEVALA